MKCSHDVCPNNLHFRQKQEQKQRSCLESYFQLAQIVKFCEIELYYAFHIILIDYYHYYCGRFTFWHVENILRARRHALTSSKCK